MTNGNETDRTLEWDVLSGTEAGIRVWQSNRPAQTYDMRFIRHVLLFVLLLAGASVHAANTSARLFLDSIEAGPGETVMAAVELKMNPGWHTYWVNSGDSGLPTSIRWTLPEGIKAGPIQWPLPIKSVFEGENLYGYEGVVTLLVPITVSAEAKPGNAALLAVVDWLECEKLCIPGRAKLSAELVIGAGRKPSPEAAAIEAAKLKLPKSSGPVNAMAFWLEDHATDRTLVVQWVTTNTFTEFFPYNNQDSTFRGASVVGQSGPGARQIRKKATLDGTTWPKEVAGVLVGGADEHDTAGYEVKLQIADATTGLSGPPLAPAIPLGELIIKFGLGLLGGLILNVMPCVLPVIALKILGVVNQNRSNPARVRAHGYAYAGGVIFSFIGMAGCIVGFRSVGVRLLWGSQFGSPVFLILLTALMILVALSLFGVFEVTLSGKVMDAASRVASSSTEFFTKTFSRKEVQAVAVVPADGGIFDSFFNGVFATMMGVSCTAPVLSAAVGFALNQPAPIVFGMFICVGLGLAGPYVILSMNPAFLKFLPRPGAWMEKFKIAMGFPMLATAVWLFTVAAGMFPGRTLWLGLSLVLLSAAAWVFGEFVQRGRPSGGTGKKLGWLTVIALVGLGYGYGLEKELNWRNPPPANAMATARDGGIPWQPWSREAIAKAQAEGRPVLVDFTADWCVNCQVNKRNAIEVPEVEEKLKAINAVSLIGDFTRTPADMTDEILSHGRAGVPLVLVYPGKVGAKPEILPELFSKATMLAALERVSTLKQRASSK